MVIVELTLENYYYSSCLDSKSFMTEGAKLKIEILEHI